MVERTILSGVRSTPKLGEENGFNRCQINALPQRPAFVMHMGDHIHLSRVSEFDTVEQIMSTLKTDRTFNVPESTMCAWIRESDT